MAAAKGSWEKFHTPIGGYSFACEAMVLEDRSAIARLRTACVQPTEEDGGAAFPNLVKAANLLNELLRDGVPWKTLALCKASRGTLGALIEAADNRRIEMGGTDHAAA